jgi:hypothetical protein
MAELEVKVKLEGAGSKYVRLLRESGFGFVEPLSQADPESLRVQLRTVNARAELVKRLPSNRMISDWIHQALDVQSEIEACLPAGQGFIVGDLPGGVGGEGPELLWPGDQNEVRIARV